MYLQPVQDTFDGLGPLSEYDPGYVQPVDNTYYPPAYDPSTIQPGDTPTYPYVPAPFVPPFYELPVPLPVDEQYNQPPIINDTTEPQTQSRLFTISGHLINAKGEPIQGATMSFRTIGENDEDTPVPLDGNYYEIEADTANYSNYGAMFRAKGYVPMFVPLETLQGFTTITMTEEKNGFPIWMILAVLAAVYIYRKKTKKVGALGMGDIFPIFLLVGGFIAFDIIKKILEALHLWDSQDTKDLNNAASDPNSAWNSNFWQQKPSNIPWSYAITDSTAKGYAKEIYDAVGVFDDCEECIKGVFYSLRTKANVSFLAYVFKREYGQELLPWLRGGIWPKDRLSDADVNEINKYIAKLPNY